MSAFIIISVVENAPLCSLAFGRRGEIMQSLILDFTLNPSCCDSFSHEKKRQFDNFWHCLTSMAMLFLMLKQATSALLLLQVCRTGVCHHLAFNSLHHP